MARAREIIRAALLAILLSVSAQAQNVFFGRDLFLRSDLDSPKSILPVEIPETLVNRTFQIPTELLARRLNIRSFSTLDDLIALENGLRRELADRHLEIPAGSTGVTNKDLRIGPPSTLFIRATRKDLAKIDLLLADWMHTVQFQIEITSVEFTPAAAVALLEKVSVKIIPFGWPRSSDAVRPSYLVDEISARPRFDRPIATSILTERQNDLLQRTLVEKGAHPKSDRLFAYSGERLDLQRSDSNSFDLPITVRPTLNPNTNADTDLTFESHRRQFVTSSYEPEVSFTTFSRWIPAGFTTITTTIEPSAEFTETISPKASLLVISAAASNRDLPPPRNSRTIIFHIITSRPVFSE